MSHELVVHLTQRPDISRPKWDQKTYEGRAKHFFSIVNPLNLLATDSQLKEAQKTVLDYKRGIVSPTLTVDQLWASKQLYDSAFHPDSGHKMFICGRMSGQVPANMIITGGLLSFYRNPRAVIFWHWLNQSYNANVNYTNRSGPHAASTQRLAVSYVCATGGALTVALGLNRMVKNASGLAARLVPFAAIALANAINIPMMRSREFQDGIEMRASDDGGEVLCTSRRVAALAIAQVVLSRISMAAPYMVLTPMIMNVIQKTAFYQSRPWLSTPVQTLLAGIGVSVTTPLCCALFPQMSGISVTWLEPELQEYLKTRPNPPTVLYYNKGL